MLLGAVYVLLLQPNGQVAFQQKISDSQGGFGGALSDFAVFGSSIAALGDVNGDGFRDLAVGAPTDSVNGVTQGALYILALGQFGNVLSHTKISGGLAGFVGPLSSTELFGSACVAIGDIDNNGFVDLAVGGEGGDDGCVNCGSVWILQMGANQTVIGAGKLSNLKFLGNTLFSGMENFGSALALGGDYNGDGKPDLIVTATNRYVAVQAVYDNVEFTDWSEDHSMLIPADILKQAAAVSKANRGLAMVTFAAHEREGFSHNNAYVSVGDTKFTYDQATGSYPPVGKLFPTSEPNGAATLAINPKWFVALSKIVVPEVRPAKDVPWQLEFWSEDGAKPKPMQATMIGNGYDIRVLIQPNVIVR